MINRDEAICVFCRLVSSHVDELGLCAKCRALMAAADLSDADIERLVNYRKRQRRDDRDESQ